MALIHSYFVDIFVHGKLLHSSASRTHVTIYDVKKCQQNTRESMPKCFHLSLTPILMHFFFGQVLRLS